ncbi:anti-repressor SinI family protein [Niallia taxi]
MEIKLDQEWLQLIMEAKDLGLSIEEVNDFLHTIKNE